MRNKLYKELNFNGKFNSNKYDLVFIILLFVGFISSSLFSYFLPMFRNFAVIAVLLYLFINIFNNYWLDRKLFIFQTFLIFYLCVQYYINQFQDHDTDMAIVLSMVFATLFFKNIDVVIKILKPVLIINFLFMFYEVISFEYIINIVEENKYEFGRMQGIFSYSKETGYFLLITFIFLRHFNISIFYKLLILVSSVMSGSRTAIIAVSTILIIDLIIEMHKEINLKKAIKKYFYFLIAFLLLLILASNYFNEKNEYMLFRIMSSLDFESSSQIDRLYYWNFYFNSLDNYSVFEWMFGKGTYLNYIIGNGAENTYLMVMSQLGLIGLFIFCVPIILIIFLFFKYPFTYYPFILLFVFLFVGRIAVGWADGILMWMLIYFVLNYNYKFKKEINNEF